MTNTTKTLKLFSVTVPWNPENADDGDYSTRLWAHGHDEALQAVAQEVAEATESGFDPEDTEGINAFAKTIVDAVTPYISSQVVIVGENLTNDVYDLLQGADCVMTPEAQADFDQIKALLAKYSIR